ncbi:hypothetical protein KIN20_032656 [Parelaphostrongylus tenuis]|uniref:Fibronectin type-III domain-containing protein n=1 Tax=Parelaphostrongylus tenuis TaxID=148309 RepID=A0AAD5R743_PARTN|nr:hypothetical protein KIN20_032656 [Parelaphostrongylus tenuis]
MVSSEALNMLTNYSTDIYLFITAQDIPGEVTNETIIRQHANSSEYAVFTLAWDPPQIKNGKIKGYRIRWKLKNSKYNLFIHEQCQNNYDLKVYYIDEEYEVYISARTARGFGPEKKLEFVVGTPKS